MPADQPFIPTTGATTGKSLAIQAVSISGALTQVGVIDSTGGFASSLLVTNTSTTVTLFVRMSTEPVPLASSLDVPIPFNTSRLFENPNPTGKTGVGVAGSVFAGAAAFVIFTPGNAGVE